MLNAIKAGIVDWLRREVESQMQSAEARIAKSMQEKLQGNLHEKACIAESTKFGPEARIENKVRKREAICIGENCFLRGRLLTYGHGGEIKIGDWCYVGDRTEIWSMNSISIGNRVLISHDVNIHDGAAHSLDAGERHEHFKQILTNGHPRKAEDVPGVPSAPIVIEDDVWISFGVSILRGVRIGKGSVIAAGSIVTKDVPPGVVYQCRIQPVTKPLAEVFQSSKSTTVSEELLEDPVF